MMSPAIRIMNEYRTLVVKMILAIKIMNEYRTLVVKMMEDQGEVDSAKTSFHHLIDVQIVVSLSCLIPMPKSLHQLM
jgi:hypothetical protein